MITIPDLEKVVFTVVVGLHLKNLSKVDPDEEANVGRDGSETGDILRIHPWILWTVKLIFFLVSERKVSAQLFLKHRILLLGRFLGQNCLDFNR